MHLRHPVVLKKMSASDSLCSIMSLPPVPERGISISSVSCGSISLANFCFRLSLEERFHRIPEGGGGVKMLGIVMYRLKLMSANIKRQLKPHKYCNMQPCIHKTEVFTL